MLLALLSDFITPLKPQGSAVCSTDTRNSHTSKYLYTLCSEHFFPTSLHSFLPYFIHLFAELPSCQSSLLWLHERAWQFLTLSVFYCFIFFIKYITRYNIMYLFANIVLSVSWEYWLQKTENLHNFLLNPHCLKQNLTYIWYMVNKC